MNVHKSMSRHPSSVVDVSASFLCHLVSKSCCKGIVYIVQSGSSSFPAGYGDSSSSNCFLSASFCIHLMASVKVVWVAAESTSLFKTPAHLAPGIAGEPRDIGIPWLDPRPDPGAHDNLTSIGEPGGRPSSSRFSCLVTGEATPLARPPTPESPEPPEVGRRMGGIVAVSLPYAGGVRGPGAGDALLNFRGSYTSSNPNSLLIRASCPAEPISFGVVYGQGTSGLGVLHWG